VIPSERLVMQHRLLVIDVVIRSSIRRKRGSALLKLSGGI